MIRDRLAERANGRGCAVPFTNIDAIPCTTDGAWFPLAEVAFACYRGFFEGFGGGFCDVCRLLRQGRFVLHTTKKGFYNAKKTEKNKGLG